MRYLKFRLKEISQYCSVIKKKIRYCIFACVMDISLDYLNFAEFLNTCFAHSLLLLSEDTHTLASYAQKHILTSSEETIFLYSK